MAGRDPTRPQLDFPDLVAELITQLRLRGQVGLLNFSDQVIPTFLIGSRGINFGGDLPAFNSASVFSGAINTPPANSVFVDTGPLPAGTYDVMANISHTGSVGVVASGTNVEHRDAANAVTLATLLSVAINGIALGLTEVLPLSGYEIGLNERLRIISPSQLLTGTCTGAIFARIRPTP